MPSELITNYNPGDRVRVRRNPDGTPFCDSGAFGNDAVRNGQIVEVEHMLNGGSYCTGSYCDIRHSAETPSHQYVSVRNAQGHIAAWCVLAFEYAVPPPAQTCRHICWPHCACASEVPNASE